MIWKDIRYLRNDCWAGSPQPHFSRVYLRHGLCKNLYNGFSTACRDRASGSYALLLHACEKDTDLPQGRYLHHLVLEHGLDHYNAPYLIRLYCACVALHDAVALFATCAFAHRQNRLLWNYLLRAHGHSGLHQDAMQLFHQLQIEGLLPNTVTFAYLIYMLGRNPVQDDGYDVRQVHARVLEAGFAPDIMVGTALVSMYGKRACLDDAKKSFDGMRERDVIAWTNIVALHVEHGCCKAALNLFEQMQLEGVLPNSVTFAIVMDVCTNQCDLIVGQRMHSQVEIAIPTNEHVLWTSILSMYGKCGSIMDASRIFDKLQDRDVITWNTMIAVCVYNAEWKSALQRFEQMQQEGLLPNRFTYSSTLDAYANEQVLIEGKRVHARIRASECGVDLVLGTGLVSMYGECGSILDAQMSFDEMNKKDVVAWTALIKLYAQHGLYTDSLQLLEHMQDAKVEPNVITYTSILDTCASKAALPAGKWLHSHILTIGFTLDLTIWNAILKMYGRCGSSEDAQKMFQDMPEWDIASWNALIRGFHDHKEGHEHASQILCNMQMEGIIPDKITFVSVLSTFTSSNQLAMATRIHTHIVGCGLEHDMVLGTALFSMYGDCGSLKEAQTLFNRLPKQDVVVWNAIISLYARHGKNIEAVCFFEQMKTKQITPNSTTLLSILAICANLASLAKGEGIHAYIRNRALESDISLANSLINFYGKCGCLDEAREIFNKIPEKNLVSWNTMLLSCAQHGQANSTFQLLDEMWFVGILPDKVTLIIVLVACSYVGLLDKSFYLITSMDKVYGIPPLTHHYGCIIDLLGRAGQLAEAEDLMNMMPVEPSDVSLTALLSACKNKHDLELGERVAKCAFDLETEVIALSILSDIILQHNNV